MAVTALAAELRAAGKDIIGLGAGEPDFDTPQHIKAAAIEAINKGDTKYTNVDGTPALKQAIINKFKTDNELSYAPNQILVSSGGKQTCFITPSPGSNFHDDILIIRRITWNKNRFHFLKQPVSLILKTLHLPLS